MAISKQMYDDAPGVPVDVANVEVQAVLQRWVAERLAWLKARTLEFGASRPVTFLQRAVVPPRQLLKAADPRELFRSITHTSAQIGTRLTQLAAGSLSGLEKTRLQRPTDIRSTTQSESVTPAVTGTDRMRGYWKARVDVLHKMLERKPEL